VLETHWVFLELIPKLKALICELEFSLNTKRVIGLIGTEKSCRMIVEINSNSIDGQTRPYVSFQQTNHFSDPTFTVRVPGLPIRDCTGSCNSSVQMCTTINAIHVTDNVIFEGLYLVLGLGTFGPWVKYPYAPTTQTVHTPTIFSISVQIFSPNGPSIFLSSRFTK